VAALGALLGALGFDYWQHKHGNPTICSFLREHVPAWMVIGGWLALTVWFVQHFLNGYDS
jgi:hypothetical protein